jgi:pseudouridine kinase
LTVRDGSRIVAVMVFVVGAVAIDVVAIREHFLDGTSNPSDIRMGLGGVGYRIFSNLEAPRRFITALAADPISRWARETLETDGDVSIQEVAGRDAGPPLYLALMESGSLKVGASDFRIVEQALTEDFVARAVGDAGEKDFLVLDANLSPRMLAALVDRYAGQTRVVVEPVSVEKAQRHLAAFHRLFLLTPTTEELEALGAAAAADPARFIADREIRHLLLTLGERGTRLYSGGKVTEFAPGAVVQAKDTTGAGDQLLASVVSLLHDGLDLPEAVRGAMDRVEQRLRSDSGT